MCCLCEIPNLSAQQSTRFVNSSFVCAAVQVITLVALTTLGSLTLAGTLPISTGGGVAMLTLGAAGLLFHTSLILFFVHKRSVIPTAQLLAVFTTEEAAILEASLAFGSKTLLTEKINEKVAALFTDDEKNTLREAIKSEADPHLYLLNRIIERQQTGDRS